MLITEQNQETMALDVSEMFFPDLSSPMEDSFSFDVDCTIAPEDDFLQQLSTHLEIPLLLDSGLSQPPDEDELLPDVLRDSDLHWGQAFSDLSDLSSGTEYEIKSEIKMEPPSPLLLPPSPDPSSSDTWHPAEVPAPEAKFVLETPPISPPQTSEGSPPSSPEPVPAATTIPVTVQTKLSSTGANNSAEPVKIVVSPVKILPIGSNGTGTKIVISQQTANTAKRIKIQPKPDNVAALPTVTIPKRTDSTDSQTIVLTAHSFAALTRQVKGSGSTATVRLATQPTPSPPSNPAPLKHEAVPVSVQTPVSLAAVSTAPTTIKCVPARQEMEMKAMKRQQRMIKNRESACLSRKKKKEYVTSLETQLSELLQENLQLKLENASLKERLSQYEESSSWNRQRLVSVGAKKTTAVLAVLLMVSVSGLLNRNLEDTSPLHNPIPPGRPFGAHRGRSLLWADLGQGDTFSANEPSGNSSSVHPTCPMFINQTESIRLDSELRRWIGVDRDKDNRTQLGTERNSIGELLVPPPFTTPPPLLRRNKPKKKRIIRKPPLPANEVELYGVGPRGYRHASFFEAINRRDDTFYVVSFSGDHLLLPALAHNKTLRPKMSLVLPALPFNESMSAPPDHVTMMQIDCEVTNTQLLQVKEGDIPEHLRQRNTTSSFADGTFGPKQKREAPTASARPYRPYFVKNSRAVDLGPNLYHRSSNYVDNSTQRGFT